MRKKLYGPSMFAVKAKICGVLYNQSSSIAFDETSSYTPASKSSKCFDFSLVTKSDSHWSAFRNHEGSTFTEKDRNKLNYRIDPSGPSHRIGPGCAGREKAAIVGYGHIFWERKKMMFFLSLK